MTQYYEAQVYDVFVIKGNTAVFKCQIPSFVSDHVEVTSWQDTASNKYLPPTDDYGNPVGVLKFQPFVALPPVDAVFFFPVRAAWIIDLLSYVDSTEG